MTADGMEAWISRNDEVNTDLISVSSEDGLILVSLRVLAISVRVLQI